MGIGCAAVPWPRLAIAACTMWALCAPAGAAVGPSAAPLPGEYEARLCVAVAEAAPSCGNVSFTLGPQGAAVLRLHDITYRLAIRGVEVDVYLFHGNMQIDEFTAAGRWQGGALQFFDAAKRTRYEVQLGARQIPSPPEPAASTGG